MNGNSEQELRRLLDLYGITVRPRAGKIEISGIPSSNGPQTVQGRDLEEAVGVMHNCFGSHLAGDLLNRCNEYLNACFDERHGLDQEVG